MKRFKKGRYYINNMTKKLDPFDKLIGTPIIIDEFGYNTATYGIFEGHNKTHIELSRAVRIGVDHSDKFTSITGGFQDIMEEKSYGWYGIKIYSHLGRYLFKKEAAKRIIPHTFVKNEISKMSKELEELVTEFQKKR